jgi:hypothetical protein
MRAAVGPYGLYVSTDGGTTWTLKQKVTHTDRCTVQVMLLQAHRTDALRMFRSVNCLAGWAFGASLEQSHDGGKTFVPFWRVPDRGDIPGSCGPSATTYGYPLALVGGAKPTSSRWYLAINRDIRYGGATVFHSDDDGATWHQVLAFQGGGTPGYNCEPGDWSVRIRGVANDTSDDARLYVARAAYRPGTFQPDDIVTSGIMMTADGGGSWTDLGRQDMGNLSHLALGPDGRTLYAANDEGVWRLDMSAPPRGGGQ